MGPLAIGLLMGGGALLRGLGGRREAQAANRQATAEHARLEAADGRRAAGRAALARGILNSVGYGGSMTDEQILAMFSGARARNIAPVPSIFSGVGAGMARVGELGLLGRAGGGSGTAAGAVTGGSTLQLPGEQLPGGLAGDQAMQEYLRIIRGSGGLITP